MSVSVTRWTAALRASLSFTVSWSLFKLISIESLMLSSSSSAALFSSCLQSFQASGSFPISRLFRWPKYWSFSISPSNEYSRLISFNIDWFDLLAVQRNLKNLLRLHSLKSSIFLALSPLDGSTFISIKDYGKTIALVIWTFVYKVMFLIFNILFRFVMTCLPRIKHLLILWL